MGTDKRERQKANRAQRQQELQKAESRRRSYRIAAIVGGGLVAVLGLVWIATTLAGDDDEPTTDSTLPVTVPVETTPSDTAPGDTAPGDTVPAATAPTESVAPVGPVASDPADDDVPSTDPDTSAPASDEECPPAEGVTEQVREFDAAPPMCLEEGATYQAVVTTNMGEFTFDLDAEAAPLTVNNFVFLARNLYFDETLCHRIITDFVVQCGDPTATGTGGPGYEFADELPAAGEYQIGSIAMANSGPDTNGSQFFIITGDQGVALPPNYSLFGDVADGFATVTAMATAGTASGTPTEDVEILSVRIIQS